MELTKEYFDEKFENFEKKFATKDDLKNFATKDDLKNFATKDDLKSFATKEYLDENMKLSTEYFDRKLESQTKDLKDYMDDQIVEQIESLAAMIKRTVSDPLQEHLDNVEIHEGLKVRVDHLEKTLLVK